MPGNLQFTTRLGAGEAVPCSVIQKQLAATWATTLLAGLLISRAPASWVGLHLLGDGQQYLVTSPDKGTESTGTLEMCTWSLTE